MNRLLDLYEAKRAALDNASSESSVSCQACFAYQELEYRIHVLKVCGFLDCNAPENADLSCIREHLQAFDAFVCHLCVERRFQPSADEQRQKERETAYRFLLDVVRDYRKRFSNYMAECAGQYRRDIHDTIQVLLTAWTQYRETMMQIYTEEE